LFSKACIAVSLQVGTRATSPGASFQRRKAAAISNFRRNVLLS
jgi:hypothetical protein